MLNCSTHLNLPEETLLANRSVVSLACWQRLLQRDMLHVHYPSVSPLAHNHSRTALQVIDHLAIYLLLLLLLPSLNPPCPISICGPPLRQPSPCTWPEQSASVSAFFFPSHQITAADGPRRSEASETNHQNQPLPRTLIPVHNPPDSS